MFTKELLLMMYAEEAHERAYDNRPAPYMWEFLEKVMMTHLRGVGQAELEYMLDLVYTEETKAAILEAWDNGQSYGEYRKED